MEDDPDDRPDALRFADQSVSELVAAVLLHARRDIATAIASASPASTHAVHRASSCSSASDSVSSSVIVSCPFKTAREISERVGSLSTAPREIGVTCHS